MNYSLANDVPDGNSVVRVRAQVMMRDDSTGGWVPMGGGGLSNVSVRKRKVHHEENDQPCKHEYLIYGRRISDQRVVLSCTIKKDFEYNKVMPTFHHWKTGNKKFGLTFQTAADARAFDKGVRLAIEDLLDGISEVTPLHHYNQADVGDDDVFMQLDLPVDKGDTHSPVLSSGKSPSPTAGSDSKFPPQTSVPPDSDYSYVKFLRREPIHEYSYPKLVDCAVTSRPLSGNGHFGGTSSSNKNVYCTVVPSRSPLSSSLEDEASSPTKKCIKESPSSLGSRLSFEKESQGLQDSLNRHNNNGSRYKQRNKDAKSAATVASGQNPLTQPFINVMGPVRNDEKSGPLGIISSRSSSDAGSSGKSGGGGGNGKKGEGGGGGRFSNSMTLTCAHCRESFSNAAGMNRRGDCPLAPNPLKKGIEAVSCLGCAKCLNYHCMSDTDSGDSGVHPCDCTNTDGHLMRRWIGLSLLSILVPCLCCYVPLMSCYACGERCNICGGRHSEYS